MGKNRIRESLIRKIANLAVHEIVAKHTNQPEAVPFLRAEIAEYRSKTQKTAAEYNWNDEDRNYAADKTAKMVKEKLSAKYSDVKYGEGEIAKILKEIIGELM